MQTIDVDVLVVGIGPSGLAAAGFLTTYGVSVLAISKYAAPAPTPRATVANARSQEVYRDLGCEKEVQAVGDPLPSIYNNLFATSLAGTELARYKSYGVPPERLSDYALASPCVGWNVPQHRLEPVLLKTARARGADVRYSNEMLHIEQTPDEVRARILDKDSGEEYLVRARYAIGADGGRSPTAEMLGIPFQGEEVYGNIVSMWVEADLEKYTAYRPGLIYTIYQPGPFEPRGAGAWLCVRRWDEWLFSVPGATAETTESELLERAYLTIGDPDVKIRVKQTYSWKVNHLYATQYRKGRIFLAGDAAHRHPPSGGLGANTSVQDAFNLAWKLAYVLKGKAGDGLLDSYHQERQPVGRHVVERANKSMRNGSPVSEALGFYEGQPIEEGWALVDQLFTDAPEAADRRAKLDDAIRLGNYRSNAIGVELGQRYTSCAVVSDGTPFPKYTQDPDLYYHRTTHPGAYLPHAWIERDRKQYSTIDITGKGRFSLIVGLGGKAWATAAAKVADELGIDLAVLFIGARCEYDDIYGEWAAVREVGDHGALLVRPDRHIAWRSAGLPDAPDKALLAALRQVLSIQAVSMAKDRSIQASDVS